MLNNEKDQHNTYEEKCSELPNIPAKIVTNEQW